MKTIFCVVGLVALATALVLPEKKSTAMDCMMCRLAVNVTLPDVDEDVHNAEDEFIAKCKEQFAAVPFLEQECLNYAHSQLDPIIKELESGTAPEDICRKRGECP